MACLEDSPVAAVVAIVHALAGTHSVHIVSGRDDIARDLTLTWLARHAIPYDVLRLRRPAELPLKNWQLKAQYVKGLMRQGYERILFLDDSPQVAENLEVIPGVMVLCVDSRYQKPYVS